MQVIVENPNTIVIDVDQGRAGRGIQNITYTEVSGQYFLIVTYTDGTTETLGPLVVTGGAVFLLGGAAGSIPYQSAPNTTVFLPIGTQNQVVVAGTSAPQYTSALTGLTVNNSAIGNTTPSTGAFTNLSASGTFALTGDQVQISEGGTGQTTANGAFNALAPSQTGNAGKYLKTDGTNASWDQLDISTADITGVLPVANGGTGASTAPGARANLSAAILGTNNDITSMTGLTGGISTPDFVQFDTTATEANAVGKVYWDASQGTLDLGLLGGNVITRIGQTLVAYVTNAEAVTITKGQVVYLFGAQGDRATVKLASNLSDATSAKTFGVVAENITANGTGFVMCQGVLEGLNLGAFTAGDTLYLGATPGSLTATKPYAPNHLVYVGLVERANAGNGQLYVKVQNGYELDEIHDVQIINPQNGQTIIYDASTSLWKNANLTAGSGISVTNGAASITVSNTGVLSFSGGTTGLTPSTSTTGAVTLGGTLNIASGGTGHTTANDSFNALAPSQTGNAGKYLKSDGTNTSWDQVDISTSDITGILPVLNGGTGANNASDARTNLNAASQSTTISAGTGLTGGGDLSANRTISIANTTVTAGAYGSASNTLTATVNAQGQLTALAATPIAIANTQISGLGTMSTQNSNSVTITGGSITGITDLAIADGGTGASDAPTARTNLGLGTSATLNAGVALGVATLDAGGTVPLSQLPASIQGGVSYQGSWNAATNTPTIVSGVGSKGYYYVVSVAGSTNIDGITDWLPGDWIIYNGTVWQKIDNTDAVASVNGYTGVVVLNSADVGAAPTSRTITAGTGLTGGGDLSANRTISIANTTVAAGSYGSASSVGTFTVNGQGQLTAAASTPIAITNTQVSGLGTMSTQNANSVAITGGSITGITDLAVADGGTGASDAATARTNLGAAASAITISAGTGLSGGGDLSANRTLSIANTTVTAASYGSASSVGTFTVNAQGQLTAAASTPIAIANTQVSGLGTMSTQNANAVAITGGSIDGVTIGGSTTGAGSFTTLTTSSTVTLNGGTANGVAYLNGSKVLTTGSALSFDGTNLGVGAGSVLTNITINGNANGGFIRGQRAGANHWFVGDTASALGSGTGLINYVYGNDPFIWYNGNLASQLMTLTSTSLYTASGINVGIGESTLYNKLTVTGNNPVVTINNNKTSVAGDIARLTLNPSGAFYNGSFYDKGPSVDGLLESTVSFASALRFSTYNGSSNVENGRFSSDGTFRVKGAGTAGSTDAVQFSGSAPATSLILDSSGNFGVGASSGGAKLFAVQSLQGNDVGTGAELLMTTSTAANDRLNLNFSMTGIQNRARAGIGAVALDSSGGYNCGLAFYTRSAADGSNLSTSDEKVRITSAGSVGINTASPSYLLDVNGTFRSSVTGGSVYTQSAGGIPRFYIGGGSGFGFNRQNAAEDIFFGEPSDTGTWRVRGAGTISLGVGSTATTMTIVGNNGQVAIGSTGLGPKLNIYGTNSNVNTTVGASNQAMLLLVSSEPNTANYGPEIVFANTYSAPSTIVSASIAGIKPSGSGSGADQYNGDLLFKTSSYPSGLTEKVRITSGGQFLVGNTTTSGGEIARFQTATTTGSIGIIAPTNGASYLNFGDTSDANVGFIGYNHTSDFMNFRTSGAERARITNNGFFKASNDGGYINSSGNFHEFVNSSSIDGNGCLIAAFTSSTVGASTSELFAATYRNSSPNNSTHRAIVVSDNTNNRMIVYSNGNIQNTNNSYGSLSDVKIKENIVDATPKLEKLCQVRVVNYNIIGETQKQIGVIAQEIEHLFPSIVDECPDYETVTTVDENGVERLERVATGTSTKGVKYSVFVPMLIKAMQEQQAIITELRQRVAALESN